MMSACRGMLCVGRLWLVVVREAVGVVSCAEIASVHSPSNIVLSSILYQMVVN